MLQKSVWPWGTLVRAFTPHLRSRPVSAPVIIGQHLKRLNESSGVVNKSSLYYHNAAGLRTKIHNLYLRNFILALALIVFTETWINIGHLSTRKMLHEQFNQYVPKKQIVDTRNTQ